MPPRGNVIIGLVNFKLAIWETNNWESNYGFPFWANQALFNLRPVESRVFDGERA